MARRYRLSAGLSEKMVLARLAGADNDLASRALRRHDARQQAVECGATAETKRTLRRAWEHARDEALVTLSLGNGDPQWTPEAGGIQPSDAKAERERMGDR